MARVTVDEEFLGGPKLRIFMTKAKFKTRWEAIGCLVDFWHIAQQYWSNDCSLVPDEVFDAYGFPEALLDPVCGLAQRREGGVYARGSQERFDWLRKRRESGKKGGLAARDARLNKNNDLSTASAEPHATAKATHLEYPPAPAPAPAPAQIKESIKEKIEHSEDATRYVACDPSGEFFPEKKPKREKRPKPELSCEAIPELIAIKEILEIRKVSALLQSKWLKIYDVRKIVHEVSRADAWAISKEVEKKNWGLFFTNWLGRDKSPWHGENQSGKGDARAYGSNAAESEKRGPQSAALKLKQMALLPNSEKGTESK